MKLAHLTKWHDKLIEKKLVSLNMLNTKEYYRNPKLVVKANAWTVHAIMKKSKITIFLG